MNMYQIHIRVPTANRNNNDLKKRKVFHYHWTRERPRPHIINTYISPKHGGQAMKVIPTNPPSDSGDSQFAQKVHADMIGGHLRRGVGGLRLLLLVTHDSRWGGARPGQATAPHSAAASGGLGAWYHHNPTKLTCTSEKKQMQRSYARRHFCLNTDCRHTINILHTLPHY